jgi:ankyrin repeat protein
MDRPEMLKALVNAGADLSFRNKQDNTMLHSMASRGKIDYIKLLLELGADVDIGKPGKTPLMMAARAGEDDAMIFLLENGADINVINKKAGDIISSLLPASYTTETLRVLIEYGIDINAKNSKGQPPLFCLFNYGGEMKKGLRENVQLLLDAGLDINAADEEGNTVLHYAAKQCSLELAELMITYGADVNSSDAKGKTPLQIMLNPYVHSCGSRELIRLLAENNTSLNTVDRNGQNSLHNAAYLGWADVVTLLASKGADLENRENDMQGAKTPLHTAVSKKHTDVVKALLELGADLEAQDKRQKTPLIRAIQSENVEIIQLLLDYQADCNAQDINGQTALHVAVEKGNKEIVQLLLNAGARTDIPNQYKFTAPELAQGLNKPEIFELFSR